MLPCYDLFHFILLDCDRRSEQMEHGQFGYIGTSLCKASSFKYGVLVYRFKNNNTMVILNFLW